MPADLHALSDKQTARQVRSCLSACLSVCLPACLPVFLCLTVCLASSVRGGRQFMHKSAGGGVLARRSPMLGSSKTSVGPCGGASPPSKGAS